MYISGLGANINRLYFSLSVLFSEPHSYWRWGWADAPRTPLVATALRRVAVYLV